MSQRSDPDMRGAEGDTPPGPARNGGRGALSARLSPVLPVLVATTTIVTVLGYLQKLPCKRVGFDFQSTVTHACYTDIYPLYFGRGLVDGKVPYLDKIQNPVEYPVLTGGFMHVMSVLSRWVTGGDAVSRGMAFYEYTVVALALCAIVTVLATSYVAGRHSMKAGLMVAASPALLLAAYINWDLLAIALSALALAAWARRHHVAAGVLLGLAVATKFYPLIFLGPLFLLCLRAGKWREFFRMTAGTVLAWLAVNLPIMILAWDSWGRFYTFNQERPVDWGSIFFLLENKNVPLLGSADLLNTLGTGLFAVLCVGIAVLTLTAPRRPRLPQLLFLVTAAFLMTNKVWSPQYVLWLLPLVALARPKLPAYLVWQVGEIVYFFGIWWFLLGMTTQGAEGIGEGTYYVALLARFLTVAMLAALVVLDILCPRLDVVRHDEVDDPAGGVLDGADDRFILRGRGFRAPTRTFSA